MPVKNKGLAGCSDIKLQSDKILAVDYTSSDRVILCLLPFNQLFAGIVSDPEEAAFIYFSCLQKIAGHCRKTGTPFLYCINPVLNQVKSRSPAEQFMMEQCFWSSMIEEHMSYLPISLLEHLCLSHEIFCVNMSAYIQRPHEYGEIFIDPAHVSLNGMRLMADVLFSYLSCKITAEKTNQILPQQYESHVIQETLQTQEKENLNNYLYQLSRDKAPLPVDEIAGAIVMNCNPFTKGHLFLIERVLPSGQYIISNVTFPEYFQKNQKQTSTIDCSKDLKMFYEKIAPALRITKRFVGTEPLCSVTGAYNKQMKKMLPAYGIEVVEIERVCAEIYGEKMLVSASMVRKLVQAGQK